MARLPFVAILALGACGSGGSGDPCTDLSSEDAVMMVDEADSTLRDVENGGTVPLIRPLQGGQIVLAGARVHSSMSCSYHAVGTMQEDATDSVLGLDMRELALNPRTDGWVVPDIGFFPLLNVPVCPSGNATSRIDGTQQTLIVDLQNDTGDLVLRLVASVIPTCSDDGCTMDCQGP
jgi:hypothetical protein